MTSSPSSLTSIVEYKGNLKIQIADGKNLPITAIGDVNSSLPLKDVFVSPRLTPSLLSVGQLVDNNCSNSFSSAGCVVQDQESGKVIARGRPRQGRLFPLYVPPIRENKTSNKLFCFSVLNKSQLWHNKLGHPNIKTLSTLFNYGLLNNSGGCVPFDCNACKLGKSKALLFPQSISRSNECFNLIHSDIWG